MFCVLKNRLLLNLQYSREYKWSPDNKVCSSRNRVMANIFTIRSTPYSYPSFIHDKGNGLALSLYLCGESNGRYDCSEDVNTFRILLEPELISDNRSRSETDLIRRDESRSIERQPITQYSLRNTMRGRIPTVRSHGCVEIESAVPVESLAEAEDWKCSGLCCLICRGV